MTDRDERFASWSSPHAPWPSAVSRSGEPSILEAADRGVVDE